MSQSLKLSKSEREQIIFNFLKGKENPLYTVEQTNHGKYVVKPKQIQLEEEAINEEPEEESINEPEPVKPINDRAQARRERRKRNRRAKQDAKKILDALTNLINSNNDESSDDDQPQAPQLIDQPNYGATKLSFHRRRLAF